MHLPFLWSLKPGVESEYTVLGFQETLEPNVKCKLSFFHHQEHLSLGVKY